MKKIYLKMGFILLTLLLILSGCQANHAAKSSSTSSQAAVTNTAETSADDKSVPPAETPAAAADPTKNWLPADGPISFPVLMYHSLAVGNSLMMPPDQFKQQLQWLKDNDYYTLTPEEAYLVLTTNKKPDDKIVWITLDDGYRNNYDVGLPIFNELGINATIFDITGYQANPNSLDLDQLKTLKASNIAIQSHTVSHHELDQLDDATQTRELVDSKQNLDSNLQQDTIAISFPVGKMGPNTAGLAQQAGYKLGVTTHEGLANSGEGLLSLNRVRVNPNISLQDYQNILEHG